jgi:hypothetical protein
MRSALTRTGEGPDTNVSQWLQHSACGTRPGPDAFYLLRKGFYRPALPIQGDADSVFVVVAGHRHQFIGAIPAVEQRDAQRHFVPYGGFQELNAQIDLGTKLRVQLLKVGVVQQDRVYGLVQPRPVFLRGGDRTVRKAFVDKGFPSGEVFIAPIQAEVQWKAHGPLT